MKNKEVGVYVHIPFCKQKCYYCDFVSYCQKDSIIEKYINAVKKEIDCKTYRHQLLQFI